MIDTFNWLMLEVFPKVFIVDVVWLVASIIIGAASADIRGDDDIVTVACAFIFFVCGVSAAVLIAFYITVFLVEFVFFYHPA